jgi:hypothetical protein
VPTIKHQFFSVKNFASLIFLLRLKACQSDVYDGNSLVHPNLTSEPACKRKAPDDSRLELPVRDDQVFTAGRLMTEFIIFMILF